jgi:hypothetical protein
MSDTKEEKGFPLWLKVAASLITLFGAIPTLSAPIIYLCGIIYDQGYLGAYGVSNEFFVRSAQEYYTMAFYAFIGEIGDAVSWLGKDFFRLFIGLAIVFIVMKLAYSGVAWMLQSGEGERKELSRAQAFTIRTIAIPSILAFVACWVLLIAVVATYLILIPPFATFYKRGKDYAHTEMSKVTRCATPDKADAGCLFLLKDGKPVGAGVLVARNSTHIALFNNHTTTVYPINDLVVNVVPTPSK